LISGKDPHLLSLMLFLLPLVFLTHLILLLFLLAFFVLLPYKGEQAEEPHAHSQIWDQRLIYPF